MQARILLRLIDASRRTDVFEMARMTAENDILDAFASRSATKLVAASGARPRERIAAESRRIVAELLADHDEVVTRTVLIEEGWLLLARLDQRIVPSPGEYQPLLPLALAA